MNVLGAVIMACDTAKRSIVFWNDNGNENDNDNASRISKFGLSFSFLIMDDNEHDNRHYHL
jgi:hypothetical protein